MRLNKAIVNAKLKKVLNFIDDKSPEILSICAVGGLIETARLSFKCRPKCDEILANRKELLKKVPQSDTKKRREINISTAKKLIPVFAPVVISGIISIAAIIFSNKISKKRLIAVTAAYNLAEGSLKDLQEKMTETMGENKVREIKDAIMGDKVEKNPPKNVEELHATSDIDQICYDSFSGRYFKSNWNRITNAILTLSADTTREMYTTVNDFYDILNNPDLPPIQAGEPLGWRAEDAIRGTLPITISTQLTPNNDPCLCIDYNNSLVMV